jgi:hypothetical protein
MVAGVVGFHIAVVDEPDAEKLDECRFACAADRSKSMTGHRSGVEQRSDGFLSAVEVVFMNP